MIRVTVFEDSDQVFCGISLSGHAGYAEAGQDIVCAAVSALVFTAYNSIEQFTEDEFEGSMDEASGDFQFHFTDSVSQEARLLMNSLILGLKNIEESYGKEYIKIQLKETKRRCK